MTTYKDAGVDIEKAEKFVGYIAQRVKDLNDKLKELSSLLITPFGGFSGGISIPLEKYKNPVIMATTDGVGTKLKIAQIMNKHSTIGIDLVAMNVNDLITSLARPLFFLDYIATGKLKEEILKEVIDGIIKGCEIAGCLLLGGETAEMPGFYKENEYDLSGFCVGIVERDQIPKGDNISPGDLLIGLPSSGIHSNGYSLVRKIIEEKGYNYHKYIPELGGILGEILLTPTKIYTKDIFSLLEKNIEIKALAHITGGGIPGNLIRVLPEGRTAVIEKEKIPTPKIFQWIKKEGKVPEEEMFKTFNMGVGMILVCDRNSADKVLETLPSAFIIGQIREGKREVIIK